MNKDYTDEVVAITVPAGLLEERPVTFTISGMHFSEIITKISPIYQSDLMEVPETQTEFIFPDNLLGFTVVLGDNSQHLFFPLGSISMVRSKRTYLKGGDTNA